MSQFVYVLEDQNSHLLKIGISLDPEFRAKQVSKDFGANAVVVGVLTVTDALKTERFLHAMFEAQRVIGEWFDLSEQQKAYLLAYFSDKPQPARKPVKTLKTSDHPEETPDASQRRSGIRLTLKEFLTLNGLRPLHIERNAREKLNLPLGENTIYRMMKNPEPAKLEMSTLNSILESASDLLGRTVDIGEVVTFRSAGPDRSEVEKHHGN